MSIIKKLEDSIWAKVILAVIVVVIAFAARSVLENKHEESQIDKQTAGKTIRETSYAEAVPEDDSILQVFKNTYPTAEVLLACREDVSDDGLDDLVVICKMEEGNRTIVVTDNGALALDILKANTFDLILLDIIMPDQDGFSILKVIRSSQNYTPVILLSGRGEDSAQVKGLELGADDYITKPFSKTVLVSKIRAMVRRTNQYVLSSDEAITEVKKGSFTLRMESQTVLKNGKEISLTSKEFSLLYLFIENPEYIFSKQELFSKVWRSDNCDDSTILVYIKKLRDKLEDDPSHPTHICTVWGKGYKFCI